MDSKLRALAADVIRQWNHMIDLSRDETLGDLVGFGSCVDAIDQLRTALYEHGEE